MRKAVSKKSSPFVVEHTKILIPNNLRVHRPSAVPDALIGNCLKYTFSIHAMYAKANQSIASSCVD